MKIILSGCTGMIGGEVLKQSLAHPAITSVVVLSRRPIPPTHPTSPKLQVIIVDDFRSYPANLLSALSGAESCIWSLGGVPWAFPDLATAREVNIEYAYDAARAIITHIIPTLPEGQNFRFIYISGHATTGDMTKKHWFLDDAIKMKGEIENRLIVLDHEHPRFQAYLARPGSVIPPNNRIMAWAGWLTSPLYPAMKVEELAAAMLALAERGREGEIVVPHRELQARGRKELES